MLIRITFFILLIAQIALVGVFFDDIVQAISYKSPETTTEQQQDGGISLFSANSTLPPSVEVTTNRVNTENCVHIVGFKDKESAESLRAWLAAQQVNGRTDTKVTIVGQSFRVYTGNFEDQEESIFAQKIVERRNPNLTTPLIYQSNEGWRVSFGQFSQEKEAEAFRDKLQNSIEGLKVFIDEKQKTTSSYQIRIIGDDVTRLKALEDNETFNQLMTKGGANLDSCI